MAYISTIKRKIKPGKHNIDEFQKHYTELKRPETDDYI